MTIYNKSITKKPDDKIQASLDLAFEMAQAGVDALARGDSMDSKTQFSGGQTPNPRYWKLDQQPAHHPLLASLIQDVFAHDDIINDRMPQVPANEENMRKRYRMNMRNLKLRKVHSTPHHQQHLKLCSNSDR